MRQIEVAAAVIKRGNEIFATQRGYGDFKDGWEFPGGKLEPGETPEEALRREIREELESDIEVKEHIITVENDYPDFHINMHCFWCELLSGGLKLLEHEAACWLPIDKNLPEAVKWLPADLEVVNEIIKD